jgi:hypothetical protein
LFINIEPPKLMNNCPIFEKGIINARNRDFRSLLMRDQTNKSQIESFAFKISTRLERGKNLPVSLSLNNHENRKSAFKRKMYITAELG